MRRILDRGPGGGGAGQNMNPGIGTVIGAGKAVGSDTGGGSMARRGQGG